MGGKSSLPEAWLTREKQQLHDRWIARAEIHSRRVLEAFLEVPRELFVPVAMQTDAPSSSLALLMSYLVLLTMKPWPS